MTLTLIFFELIILGVGDVNLKNLKIIIIIIIIILNCVLIDMKMNKIIKRENCLFYIIW